MTNKMDFLVAGMMICLLGASTQSVLAAEERDKNTIHQTINSGEIPVIEEKQQASIHIFEEQVQPLLADLSKMSKSYTTKLDCAWYSITTEVVNGCTKINFETKESYSTKVDKGCYSIQINEGNPSYIKNNVIDIKQAMFELQLTMLTRQLSLKGTPCTLTMSNCCYSINFQ